MLHAVTANFLGDNLQCWMQIQVGKGPWASEVSGIVKIGQTMTMVLAIKDDENKFDMLVRNCVAHDGKRAPIQLVDQHGCVVRPKIMSKFQKIKNFGPSASVVSFAYFQAFKFPDSMNVHFQCVIQVCRYNCPEPKCGNGGHAAIAGEYGLPGPSGDYGPPHLPDYGVDPRHQAADATGAYSENQESVVPPPQAQTSQSGTNANVSEDQSEEQQASASTPQQQVVPNPQSNEVHLPPPPPPGQGGYSTVKRKDTFDNSGNLMTLGGRPRSVEGLDDLRGIRRRRETETMSIVVKPRIYKRDAQEMTDVNTSRTIQVVAPGDVNFALNNSANNETVVFQSRTVDPDTICMSVPSFVGGLVMLLLVLAVASLVAAFLFVRVRHFDRKGATAYVSEFMKVN
jgi:Zona pellucida-like domain